MNYITSCPKCDTQFVLNDDLIKAYRGKVQCGTCEHVFNAKTNLTEVADDITNAEEYQASLEEAEFSDTAAETDAQNHADEEIIIMPPVDTDNDAIEHYISDTTSSSNPIDDFNAHVTSTKKEKRKIKHPFLVGLLMLLLILVAASQTIYHLRDRIAAEYPQFRPLLVKACVPLRCEVGLPKELDAITIGDSDMQENDSYESVINFTSSLTNIKTYPIAYPNIVLTLTNEEDRTVIQKLVKPKEYLAGNKKVKDGIPGRGVSTIKLPLFVDESIVAGYRILLVYP